MCMENKVHGPLIFCGVYFAGCARLVVTFGDVIVEGVGYGATATITCHHGYRIVGPSSVICLGDRWSNVPSCYIAGM